jgi:aspartate/methionine/tyrosine aminotransferase
MGWRVGYIALPRPEGGGGGSGHGGVQAADAAAAARVADDMGDGFELMSQLLKIQDSIPICAAQISQIVALAALEGAAAGAAAVPGLAPPADDGGGGGAAFGEAYVAARVAELASANREAVRAALAGALGPGAVAGGEGGIYFFVRLPEGVARRDEDVVRWLVARAGVCVLPGSSCQAPGWLRVAFANLPPAACAAAAARLGAGLAELKARGGAALDEDLP